ncbi:DUF935 family protein, partial [Vibrio parahaemolyticus]|nr:DUF935 family protein [Vibrio parahaemolyticus]
WAHDKTQIPMAKDGEAVLSSSASAPPEPNAPDKVTNQAALKAQSDKDVVDDQLANLHSQSATLLEGMIEPVRELVENATSLKQLRDDILGLQGQISIDELGEMMAQAMAAAELAGINDVEDGK